MSICPKTFKGCCDDLCYGGGCLLLHGAAMYSHCIGCNQLISDDDTDACTCDYDYYEDQWDEQGSPLKGAE